MKKLLTIAAMGVALTGCASAIHGTSDNIFINSLEKGTTIYVDGSPRGKDNAMVDVKRGKIHQIRATKKDCKDAMVETSKKFDPASLLGIAIDFGIVTIPMDFLIGGAMEVTPKTYTVTPIC